ncbi:MAG: hypothetical protein AAFO81_07440 [Pseudomonadota bacterium]
MNKWILIALAAGTLTACGRGDQPALTAADMAEKPEIQAATIAGDSIGKPTLPIKVDYTYAQTPTVGEPLTVQLRVESRDISAMTMNLSTRGEVALSKSTPASIAMKGNGVTPSAETHDIVMTPAVEGRSYLNVVVNGTYIGEPVTKAVSIPIQVGSGGPSLSSNGAVIATDVEVLTSMPAQQTVEPADGE